MRKWTDHEFIEDASFIQDWEETFDGFWENFENIYPKQPYQPTLISMGYKYSLRDPSNFNPQPNVVHFESITDQSERFFKCYNHSEIKHGTYECKFQTFIINSIKSGSYLRCISILQRFKD